MNPINKKPQEQTPNYFYGVDVNNEKKVQEEYKKLQQQHKIFTLIVIIAIAVLGLFAYDFYRVDKTEGKPIFAISQKIEGGVMYTGIGYKLIHCDNGQKFMGATVYGSCTEMDATYINVIYKSLMDYAEKNGYVNKANLNNFEIVENAFDEANDHGGDDLYLKVKFSCVDGSDKCFRVKKDYADSKNIDFFISLNKSNEVYQILPFKPTGKHYESIIGDFSNKVKTYMLNNAMIDSSKLRDFKVNIVEDHGRYRSKGVLYDQSYLIEIQYLCVESNTCVTNKTRETIDGDFANLTFNMSVFMDSEGVIQVMGPKEYFNY